MIHLRDYVAGWPPSPLAGFDPVPWRLTSRAAEIVAAIALKLEGYERIGHGIAAHPDARVEDGAVIRGPAIIGPGCFLAHGSLVRGGCWLEADCVIGPGVELKSSFLFRGAAVAHLAFVGDSVIGAGVNIEAGAVIANRRNERDGEPVRVVIDGISVTTGTATFGALVGDRAKIGANAVLAPGSILPTGAVVGRLALVDQDADTPR